MVPKHRHSSDLVHVNLKENKIINLPTVNKCIVLSTVKTKLLHTFYVWFASLAVVSRSYKITTKIVLALMFSNR